jgi:peroxin-4
LLENPNADSPLNCDCGNLLRNGDEEAYRSMARMYTGEYALSKAEFQKRLAERTRKDN